VPTAPRGFFIAHFLVFVTAIYHQPIMEPIMSHHKTPEHALKQLALQTETIATLIQKAALLKATSSQARILLDEYQASILTGFEVPTLRKRRWQGLPPQFLKIGSNVRYDYFELERFINSCVRNSTSDKGREYKATSF
jgi:hypothetical protein